jgi:predicted DNA-binding antitoxin AbrB/MazE fold protein
MEAIVSHLVVEATYENGVLRPDHPLPLKDREKVRLTVESVAVGAHSLLDIQPVNLGKMLELPASEDDLLGDMIKDR